MIGVNAGRSTIRKIVIRVAVVVVGLPVVLVLIVVEAAYNIDATRIYANGFSQWRRHDLRAVLQAIRHESDVGVLS